MGWASFQSSEARALLDSAMQSNERMLAAPWNRAREGFVNAIKSDPDNPAYHQALGDLYLLRLTSASGNRSAMKPFYEIALQHYFKAAALRPTWPYSHAGIISLKQQIGQIDADFKHALVMASRYGPSEPTVQEQIIFAGYQSWKALGPAEHALVLGNLRRAWQVRPKQTAQLLTRLKPHLPPCDQVPSDLARDLPGACAAPNTTPPPPPPQK